MASSSKDQPSSTIPTSFLHTDPFPSTSKDGTTRPASATSTTTNATSEFGRPSTDFASAKERQSNIPSVTGPVGEPGLPPSRPTSSNYTATTTQRWGGSNRGSLQPPGSRRGLQAQIFGSRGGGTSDGSRPGSSMSNTRTHVPTLTAQGFFRPMSSSKLQAQRNQTQASSGLGQSAVSTADNKPAENTREQRSRRYSSASLNTLRDAPPTRQDEEVPPLPVSRGTQFTSDGQNTAASVTSATPVLQGGRGTRNPPPQRLEVNGNGNGLRSSNGGSDKAPKSPRSLRASLGIGSRASKQEHDRRPSPGQAHEKLYSNPSSPQDASEKAQLPIPNQSSQPQSRTTGKNYEYFAGNMLFFLSGRCLNTRARPLNVATFILTALPAALFLAFSAPWLWHHVSPALPILFAYVFYITMSSFLHAALSDPGILPRNLHPHPPNPEEDRDPLTVGPPTTEWIMVKTFPSTSPRIPLPGGRRNDTSGESGPAAPTTAMEVPTKYCKTCSIWRPPRAHHCRVCDACIETQDHHCVWLNNCVGRRNYRYFFSYVAFGSLLAIMLLAFSITHVAVYAHNHHISFSHALAGRVQERVAFAMFLYAILALPYPGSLFAYHLFLIARGETTREYLNSHKFLPKDRHRPFAQSSLLRNWLSVLARPRTPTYLQFKRRYTPGDVRMGHSEPKKQRKQNVQSLKKRYSIQGMNDSAQKRKSGANGGGGGQARDMEMKELPPLPRPGTASTAGAGGLSGARDATPR